MVKELQKKIGGIYFGERKTIATDVFFIVENIGKICQMDTAGFERVIIYYFFRRIFQESDISYDRRKG